MNKPERAAVNETIEELSDVFAWAWKPVPDDLKAAIRGLPRRTRRISTLQFFTLLCLFLYRDYLAAFRHVLASLPFVGGAPVRDPAEGVDRAAGPARDQWVIERVPPGASFRFTNRLSGASFAVVQNYEPLRFDETCASDEDVYFDTEGEPLMLPQPYVDHALSRVDPVSADLTLLLNRTLTRELLSAPDPAGFWARNLDEDYVWTDADRGLVSPLLSAVDDLVKAGVLEIRATYDGPWFYQISAAARALAGAAEAFALRWRDPRFRVWLGALVGDWDAAYHAAYLIHRRDLMEVVLSRQDSALADPAGDRPDEAEDAPAAGDSWPGRTGE